MSRPDQIRVSMSRFNDFVATDHLGQVAKLRAIQKQFEEKYNPATDFWAPMRDLSVGALGSGGGRAAILCIPDRVHARKRDQYESACDGIARFLGRSKVEFVEAPRPTPWEFGRLRVSVNPEWAAQIDGGLWVVKLHLKRDLKLDQRSANPLLQLLDTYHGGPGRRVLILDAHRGKAFKLTRRSPDYETTLRMQASSFVAGWEELERRRAA